MASCRGRMAWFVAFLAVVPSVAQDQMIHFDFETGDLQGWQIVEGRFDEVVCGKDRGRNAPFELGKQGRYFLSTIERPGGVGDDAMMGVIESPVFELTGGKITFRIGGGDHPETYVALCSLDGSEVLQARGPVSEIMAPVEWDASPFIGERMVIRVVDHHQGGWGHITCDDFTIPGQIDEDATAARRADVVRRRAEEAVRTEVTPLREAIANLMATYGDDYPEGWQYLARCDALRDSLRSASGPEEQAKVLDDLGALRRGALIASPAVSGHPLLFVARPQYLPDHHNTETMFQTGEINTGSFRGGGALKAIDLRTGESRTLVDVPDGIARDPDVSFDGERVIFSMRRNIEDDYHIYEVRADGSSLTQLTFGHGLSDIDPLYLPDGRIAFTSTREPKYCMCNRHIMGNLFRMEADGANITQVGKSTLHEGHGSLLPDGRIIYDRWEYVDRNFGDAQGLWACNPDGTEHSLVWGNNTRSPGAVLEGRAIPGAQQILANFSSCHDRPWGALAIIDRQVGLEGKAPVVRTWPAAAIDLVMQGDFDRFTTVSPKYEDPYPLTSTQFLCSRMTGEGERMGIYLVDVFGNEVQVHVEGPGCFDPMPLAPRPRPPLIPDRVQLARDEGAFYVYDVYAGTDMETVPRGSVKYLRIVESPEKRFFTADAWLGQGQEAPAMNWHDFNNKRIIGAVPVEEDGSAYFTVPADTYVFFQILDERGMMIQSMRSGTIVRPGEMSGCIGCHDRRDVSVPGGRLSAAMMRPASRPAEWYGPSREFSYVAEVQPVFDRYCVSCHDFGEPAGEKLNLAGDRGLSFCRSYNELWRKEFIHVVGAGPAEIQPPYSWGSHASRLAQVLLQGHYGVELDGESFDRIVTWIDLNAPYYPSYASSYPDGRFGRSPLDRAQLEQLGRLVGTDFFDGQNDQGEDVLVSFDRPELSPCLLSLPEGDPRRVEALGIIRAGSRLMAERPREDMPGAALVGVDATREARYVDRERIEREVRQAVLTGGRVYPYAQP